MGALWSETDGNADDDVRGDPLAALLRAIDLRRLSPYHASAAGKTKRRATGSVAGRAVRIGVWLPEDEGMPEYGAKRRGAGPRFILPTNCTAQGGPPALATPVVIRWTPALAVPTALAP